MKKVIMVLSLLTFLAIDAWSQWYVKRYNVQEVELLNEMQLEESLQDTKNNIYTSLVVTGVGGLVIMGQTLWPYEETEESTFIESLMGEELVNDLYLGLGAAIVAAGLVATVTYLARLGTIRSTLEMNFPRSGSLCVSPSLFIENSSRAVCPGVTVTFKF